MDGTGDHRATYFVHIKGALALLQIVERANINCYIIYYLYYVPPELGAFVFHSELITLFHDIKMAR